MVKVPYQDGLYGPYYRVEKPYTPEEAAYFNSGPDYEAPYPYDHDYYLGGGEHPPDSPESEAQMARLYKSLEGPVTFYGGSPSDPHRKSPTIDQMKAAGIPERLQASAATSAAPDPRQPPPAKRSSRP